MKNFKLKKIIFEILNIYRTLTKLILNQHFSSQNYGGILQ